MKNGVCAEHTRIKRKQHKNWRISTNKMITDLWENVIVSARNTVNAIIWRRIAR